MAISIRSPIIQRNQSRPYIINFSRTRLKRNLDITIMRTIWKKLPNYANVSSCPSGSLIPKPVFS